jgi:hypothetical protein
MGQKTRVVAALVEDNSVRSTGANDGRYQEQDFVGASGRKESDSQG